MTDAAIKRLMKDLGDAINESLAESAKVNDCIQNIRDVGYDIFLIIETKIGFNRKAGKEEGCGAAVSEKPDEPVRLRITNEDAKFLKSLKISVDSER